MGVYGESTDCMTGLCTDAERFCITSMCGAPDGSAAHNCFL